MPLPPAPCLISLPRIFSTILKKKVVRAGIFVLLLILEEKLLAHHHWVHVSCGFFTYRHNNENKYCENCQDTIQKHKVNRCCWKNGASAFGQCPVATDLQFVKNAISVGYSKAKYNEMRHICTVFFTSKYVLPTYLLCLRVSHHKWMLSFNKCLFFFFEIMWHLPFILLMCYVLFCNCRCWTILSL